MLPKSRSLLWMFLILLQLASMTAWAADPIGVLTVQEGVIKLTRSGQERFFRAQDGKVPVQEGDDLHSGSGARGSVRIERENQTIAIYPGTMFQVKAYTKDHSFFYMPFGKTLVKVLNKLRPEQRFEVRTATATIGIKGTEFVLGSDGVSQTILLTIEGVVSLVNPEFPNQEVVVGKDQAAVSVRGNPPPPPVNVSPEDRDNAVKGDSLQSMQALPVSLSSTNPDDEDQGSPAPASAAAAATAATQAATEAVASSTQSATTTVISNVANTTCPSSKGCGTLTFSW